jgi:hypothetical protein
MRIRNARLARRSPLDLHERVEIVDLIVAGDGALADHEPSLPRQVAGSFYRLNQGRNP